MKHEMDCKSSIAARNHSVFSPKKQGGAESLRSPGVGRSVDMIEK